MAAVTAEVAVVGATNNLSICCPWCWSTKSSKTPLWSLLWATLFDLRNAVLHQCSWYATTVTSLETVFADTPRFRRNHPL
jgi:hypothetical protein